MLLRAPVPQRALRWLLRLVRLHDCEATLIAPGLWWVEGTRVAPLLADVLQDTRVSIVQAIGEA